MNVLGYLGRGLLVTGAALVPLALSLRFYDSGTFHETGWKAFSSTDIVLTVLAAAAALLAVLSFFLAPRLLVAAAALAFTTLGWFIPERSQWHYYGRGVWLGLGGAAVMAIGGTLAYLGSPPEIAPIATPQAAAPPAGPPPPGWYPDPGGSGRARWWTGSDWSDRLQ
jgi:Protein of unknown function (DUF2510)